MRPVVSAEEMRRADAAAIAAGTPPETLMERAGAAVARAVLRWSGGRYGRRVAVVCGPGNNGGDGYVAGRFLLAQGIGVVCLTVSDPADLTGAARVAWERFAVAGGRARPFEARLLKDAGVIVDAIFGTGFHGQPMGAARDAITAIAESRDGSSTKVVSVDVPSGAGGPGPMVHSDVTISLGAEKLETAALNPALSGVVEVADIGIEVADVGSWMTEPSDLAGVASRDPGAHKWTRSVVILAGSDAMTGAAVLAGRGAFRAGAGYVTVVTTPGVAGVVRARLPEAVVQVAQRASVLTPEVCDRAHAAFEKAGAVAVGPGIGIGDDQKEMVRRILAEVDKPVVLDADGLNVLQDETEVLRDRVAPLVITPHAGELARLLERSAEDIQENKVASAQEAGERFGCTVVLKGPRTLTYQTGRGLIVNPTGGPELATAGTGDVLTGIMAALASGESETFTPAWQAVYLHGLAASLATTDKGSVGLVAWDVAEAVPQAIAQLSAS
jgi:ADP-dependent NAD(P)H-hydrate dehydratase / NAD(P)H-hydrate epimerase